MNLSTYVAELSDSLAAAAALGDDATQRSTAALAGALEPATRLALLHALSDLATEVTQQLASTASTDAEQIAVDVRLEGRDVKVVATRSPATTPFGNVDDSRRADAADTADADGHQRTFAEASGDLSRTTVRMFNQLKSQAERAASEQGVSLNSFISRAVSDSIRGEKTRRHGRSGDRRSPRDSETTISGYVQG